MNELAPIIRSKLTTEPPAYTTTMALSTARLALGLQATKKPSWEELKAKQVGWEPSEDRNFLRFEKPDGDRVLIYDREGNLVMDKYKTGVSSYCYDQMGRLVRMQSTQLGTDDYIYRLNWRKEDPRKIKSIQIIKTASDGQGEKQQLADVEFRY